MFLQIVTIKAHKVLLPVFLLVRTGKFQISGMWKRNKEDYKCLGKEKKCLLLTSIIFIIIGKTTIYNK